MSVSQHVTGNNDQTFHGFDRNISTVDIHVVVVVSINLESFGHTLLCIIAVHGGQGIPTC